MKKQIFWGALEAGCVFLFAFRLAIALQAKDLFSIVFYVAFVAWIFWRNQ